jgi:hypothetical protein
MSFIILLIDVPDYTVPTQTADAFGPRNYEGRKQNKKIHEHSSHTTLQLQH